MKRLLKVTVRKAQKKGPPVDIDLTVVPIDNDLYINLNDIDSITNVSVNYNKKTNIINTFPTYCKP